jgi:hypothetical protein
MSAALFAPPFGPLLLVSPSTGELGFLDGFATRPSIGWLLNH